MRQNFAPLGRVEPDAEDFLGAVDGHADRDVRSLVLHDSLVADLYDEGVEVDGRVDGLQRPLLPLLQLVDHRVGDARNQVGGDLRAVNLGQMALDLAHRHLASVHRQDLVVEAVEVPLVLRDDIRIEGRVPVPRHRDGHRAVVGTQRLLLPVARVARGCALGPVILVADMIRHLGLEGPLHQGAGQLLEKPAGAQQVLR